MLAQGIRWQALENTLPFDRKNFLKMHFPRGKRTTNLQQKSSLLESRVDVTTIVVRSRSWFRWLLCSFFTWTQQLGKEDAISKIHPLDVTNRNRAYNLQKLNIIWCRYMLWFLANLTLIPSQKKKFLKLQECLQYVGNPACLLRRARCGLSFCFVHLSFCFVNLSFCFVHLSFCFVYLSLSFVHSSLQISLFFCQVTCSYLFFQTSDFIQCLEAVLILNNLNVRFQSKNQNFWPP